MPGDIVALAKGDELQFDAVLHDSHDEDNLHLRPLDLPEPMSGLAILPQKRGDEQKIADALTKLLEEDPTFRVTRDPVTHETVIHGLGDLHLRIMLEKLEHQHHVQVATQPPKVAYRETITSDAGGEHKLIKQTGGKGQYGHVILKVSPNKRGSGFTFNNRIVGGEIPKEFFNACETGIREALGNGVIMGYPVVDVHVDLVGGSSHDVDSNEQAFKIAAILAMRDAFQNAGSILLEPIMKVSVALPDEYQGDIIGDLNRRRGRIAEVGSRNGLSEISAEVPLAEMFGYATDMRSLSKGRASFSMEPLQFEEVPEAIVTRMTEQYV